MNGLAQGRQRRYQCVGRDRQAVRLPPRPRATGTSGRYPRREDHNGISARRDRRTVAANVSNYHGCHGRLRDPRQEVKCNTGAGAHCYNGGSVKGGVWDCRVGLFLAVGGMGSEPVTVLAVDDTTSIGQTGPMEVCPSAVSVAPLVGNAPKAEWDALITETVSRIMSGVDTISTRDSTAGTRAVGVVW